MKWIIAAILALTLMSCNDNNPVVPDVPTKHFVRYTVLTDAPITSVVYNNGHGLVYTDTRTDYFLWNSEVFATEASIKVTGHSPYADIRVNIYVDEKLAASDYKWGNNPTIELRVKFGYDGWAK